MNPLQRTQTPDGKASTENHSDIIPEETTVCVVGLGYVGLPLAVRFDESGYDVIGYDISAETVDRLDEGIDTTGDLGDAAIADGEVTFTTDPATIEAASYVLVTVPTPIDETHDPKLDYVESAAETVGQHMTAETTVILESTVYPGATREVMGPALEAASGLDCGEEFSVGYSPERANPGDEDHGLRNVVKIVSGQTDAVTEDVATLYDHVVDAGVHRAPSMAVAEAAKVVENVQRDVNIGLVNDLAKTFERLDIDTEAVLSAAGTKWNFHDYRPGLVSGHCIPVDPYFLLHRAKQAGASPDLIEASRSVNESMPKHVADLMVKALTEAGRPLADARVLVAGLTYKADVADIRNAKIGAVIEELREYGIEVVGYDPLLSDETIAAHLDIESRERLSFEGVDGLLLGSAHEDLRELNPNIVAAEMAKPPAIVDVNGIFDVTDVSDEVAYRRV
ncbi:nucleotide sugar dehydrogenase [Haloarcula onubensis]|uniref:UDP-N-acetyl-D-mannosamine dehydrogenase n=1 Tax=Haloarcula onubensis TaxID=2950539 RepID=A0ABU2FQU2_9EURY|nr:nucleotide sugar dehydrogenase [Halomicroarcula sp. S3CR25-11]MDS0282641.1 nucleotide sugar dehydrogenase [Halomicroarcula sp. S3CR25-11]